MTRHTVELPSVRTLTIRAKGKRSDKAVPLLSWTPALIPEISSAEMPLVARRGQPFADCNAIACLDGVGMYVKSQAFTDLGSLKSLALSGASTIRGHYPHAFMCTDMHRAPLAAYTMEHLQKTFGDFRIVEDDADHVQSEWVAALDRAFVIRDGEIWQAIDRFPSLKVKLPENEHVRGSCHVNFIPPSVGGKQIAGSHTFGLHETEKAANFIVACGYRPPKPDPYAFEILDASAFEAHTPDARTLLANDIGIDNLAGERLQTYLYADSEEDLPLEVREASVLLQSWSLGDPSQLDALATVCDYGWDEGANLNGFHKFYLEMRHFAVRWSSVEKPIYERATRMDPVDEGALAALGAF